MGADIESIKAAEKELHQLVDRFYRENEDMIAPQQYEAAKRDFEYFMRLVELAIAYHPLRAEPTFDIETHIAENEPRPRTIHQCRP